MAEPGVAPGTTSPAPKDRHGHTVVSAVELLRGTMWLLYWKVPPL